MGKIHKDFQCSASASMKYISGYYILSPSFENCKSYCWLKLVKNKIYAILDRNVEYIVLCVAVLSQT